MPTESEIIAACSRVVNNAFVGLLTTVDEDGAPHSRYMGAAPVTEGLHKLYTLTGRRTRKLKHIKTHAEVCWVFATAQYGEIATLYGTAQVLSGPVVAQQVWDRLADCARAYAMNVLSDQRNVEFVTIETVIHTVEYLCPAKGIVVPEPVSLNGQHAT